VLTAPRENSRSRLKSPGNRHLAGGFAPRLAGIIVACDEGLAVMTAGLAAAALAALWIATDPFALLEPAKLTPADRRALERGEVVSGTLEGSGGQIGVFAISRIDTTAESLVSSARSIEDMKKSSFVRNIRRLSDPPRIEDLDALVLPPKELQAAASCRRGSCSMKLSAEEIDQIVVESSRKDATHSDRVQRAFRAVVFSRIMKYLAAGPPELAPLVNREPVAGTESFLYWSLESYGAGKPVVLVTHVNILPPSAPGDAAVVIGRQIFANHYINDGLAVTAIATDAATGSRYLIYRNNTNLDLLGGILGPIRRAVLESRLRRDVPGIIQKLRARLEKQDRPAR
jgi:hypothetical protein